MNRKFRIKKKVFFRDDTKDEFTPIITRVVRPIIQMKVLFFWVTVKEYLYYTVAEADSKCDEMYHKLIEKE